MARCVTRKCRQTTPSPAAGSEPLNRNVDGAYGVMSAVAPKRGDAPAMLSALSVVQHGNDELRLMCEDVGAELELQHLSSGRLSRRPSNASQKFLLPNGPAPAGGGGGKFILLSFRCTCQSANLASYTRTASYKRDFLSRISHGEPCPLVPLSPLNPRKYLCDGSCRRKGKLFLRPWGVKEMAPLPPA